jgi:hypothetical protein
MKEMGILWDSGSLAFIFRERSFWSFELVALVFSRVMNFSDFVVVLNDWQPLKSDPQQRFGQEASLRNINRLEKRWHPINIQAARSGRDRIFSVLPRCCPDNPNVKGQKSRRNSESTSKSYWRARRDSNS